MARQKKVYMYAASVVDVYEHQFARLQCLDSMQRVRGHHHHIVFLHIMKVIFYTDLKSALYNLYHHCEWYRMYINLDILVKGKHADSASFG